MRIRSVLALALGSVLVHLGVSCAAKTVDKGGGVAATVDAIADAVKDALGGDDTKPAEAGPEPKPTVDVVSCDKTTATGVKYAEKEYAGRTKEDLVRVAVLNCGTTPVPEYACAQLSGQPVLVRDGAIAVLCGTTLPSVTFVVPPAP